MSEYPRIEFRCSPEMFDHIFRTIASPEFVEAEITRSMYCKACLLVGDAILNGRPSMVKSTIKNMSVKGDNE